MKRHIIVFFSLIVFNLSAWSQEQVKYELNAQEHAFMCPFLSPILMRQLQEKGASEVIKTSDYKLLITFNSSLVLTEEEIMQMAVKVGYQREILSIKLIGD